MNRFYLITFVLILSILAQTTNAQTRVLTNKTWEIVFGNPASGIEWAASVVDPFGNVITVGNTVDEDFNVNLLLVKQSSLGVTLWEEEYSAGTDSKNYGVALILDATGNIYVAGATFNPTNQNHDYLILKYNSLGTLQWSHIENGPDDGDDVPSSIVLDSGGNVYVTGTSFGNTTNFDYLTLRLDSSGTVDWTDRYDYNSLPDVAVSLDASTSGFLTVTGGISTTITDWNIGNVRYNSVTGTVAATSQTGNVGSGIETPTAVTTNSNNDLIISGYGGTQNNCYVAVLDDDFNLVWEEWYDGGFDDRGYDVEVDADDNIYVCGTTEKSNGGKDYLLIKYDSNGDVIWTRKRNARDRTKSAEALFLEIDPTYNHILVTGEEEGDNGNTYLKTIRYDHTGKILWEGIHDGNETAPETATGLMTKTDGGFVVTGTLQKPDGSLKYQSITYDSHIYTQTFDTDANGNPVSSNGKILIRFYPTVMDSSFVNNQNRTFGRVDEILTDQTLILQMDDSLRAGGRVGEWVMEKVYAYLGTNDRFFTAKHGATVPINSVWTTYHLFLEGSITEKDAVNALNNFDFEDIVYAIVEPVAKTSSPPDPNDEHFSFQAALKDMNGFTNASINIDPAWDEVTGTSSIEVGFIDSGLNFGHPDFGTSYSGLGGSIVEEGFDFLINANDPIQFDDDDTDNDPEWPHGTRMAGIVGALRNNGIGISGVAGGNVDDGGAPGVRMSFFKVFDDGQPSLSSDSDKAFLYAVIGPNNSGPMVDVLNHSYDIDPKEGFPQGDLETFIFEVLTPAYKSGVISAASRGNITPSSADVPNWPATISEKMMISVGASGTNGELKEFNSNSSLPGTREEFMSKYGSEMDIIAPGTSNLILTTNNLQDINEIMLINQITCDDSNGMDAFSLDVAYNCFGGTSSGTAFTSGVSALILEQHQKHNLDLAIEDVERLLEYGSTDVSSSGYDEKNGWGRLNAGKSVELIAGDQKVIHFQLFPQRQALCNPEILCSISLTRFYECASGECAGTGMFDPDDVYSVQVYKHTYNLDIDFCTDYSSPVQLVDPDPGIDVGKDPIWLLNSRSNLWGETIIGSLDGDGQLIIVDDMVVPEDDIFWEDGPYITGNCSVTGTIVGYTYEIDGESAPEERTIPNDGNPYQMWFSVLLDDPQDVFTDDVVITSVDQPERVQRALLLFPNPTQDRLTVTINQTNSVKVYQFEIYDINGNLVMQLAINAMTQMGDQWEIDTSNFTSGMYFIRAISEAHTYQGKFIKMK